jgi:arabinogalactan endo-1,4-beta-galactosidase
MFRIKLQILLLIPSFFILSRCEKAGIPAGDIAPGNREKTQRCIGADISCLPQLESEGRKFYDNSVEKDPVRILADHGMNFIRLRIFVNPENPDGYSPSAGFCGLKSTLQMAARVKNSGMGLLLDFHYSDYWADPSQQTKPLAWKDLSFNLLKDSLKSYTKRVLIAMKAQGTLPDIVQTGNEINHGLLWPDGNISDPDKLAELLKSCVEGVKEVDTSIVIMMHIATGGQNSESRYWLDNMISRGLEFDVTGLSYYPQWHGTLDDLQSNLTDLDQRYKKSLSVVEYDQNVDQVNDIVFNLPDKRGRGTFNWEPINRFFDSSGNPTQQLLDYDSLAKKYLPGE